MGKYIDMESNVTVSLQAQIINRTPKSVSKSNFDIKNDANNIKNINNQVNK